MFKKMLIVRNKRKTPINVLGRDLQSNQETQFDGYQSVTQFLIKDNLGKIIYDGSLPTDIIINVTNNNLELYLSNKNKLITKLKLMNTKHVTFSPFASLSQIKEHFSTTAQTMTPMSTFIMIILVVMLFATVAYLIWYFLNQRNRDITKYFELSNIYPKEYIYNQ